MDIDPNVNVSSGFSDPWDFAPESSKDGNDESGLEWLSIYVEDCLSSGATAYWTQLLPSPKPETLPVKPDPTPNPIPDPNQPCKSVFKRKRGIRIRSEEQQLVPNQTSQWLADSEPIYPLSEPKPNMLPNPPKKRKRTVWNKVAKEEKAQRRCTHCLSNKTPQWREGPKGPKTLCNACGVRFKSGRLFPEYRPAKSPTFMSCKHSNSHKKVLEMRRNADVSSNSD